MTALTLTQRVQRRRNTLRMSGLRPIQIWVPDTRRPDFAAECRRQSLLVAAADNADAQLQGLMDDSLTDMDGWTE